ncbi:hypothetical protein BGE01nite_43580 [Brevifollis gellanilyticus]|uniref:Uncharacterized protein n=1 Tax=Brevifollis gellanilyticus TaxID=748831 RepID=A0A512MEA3_9BACT|nr:hypothetical protein BGE01nite_43580 [Brevifollis gellanilyticus]
MNNFSSDLELPEEVAPNHSLSWLYDAVPEAEQDEDREPAELSAAGTWANEYSPL